MDWSDTVRKAAALAVNGTITFAQLDALIPPGDYAPEELDDLLAILQAGGIDLVQDNPTRVTR